MVKLGAADARAASEMVMIVVRMMAFILEVG
jgi:hypothetical protein